MIELTINPHLELDEEDILEDKEDIIWSVEVCGDDIKEMTGALRNTIKSGVYCSVSYK